MNKLMVTILLFILVFSGVADAQQQVFNITDSIGANANGLYAGYEIVDFKQKEVSDKRNFGRYSIDFFVTNTGTEATKRYRCRQMPVPSLPMWTTKIALVANR